MQQKVVRYFGLQNKPSPGAIRVFAVVRRYSQVLARPPIFAAKKQKKCGCQTEYPKETLAAQAICRPDKQALVRD